jgi:hypothetical protein
MLVARSPIAPVVAVALALLVAPPALAQQPADPTFGHSRHGVTFDEGPRQRPRGMPGFSSEVHFPVQGLDEATQQLFDQGLCQQHGFWYFEAERSFREVASRVPTCALAYWGMAMANVDQRERAAGFAARAVQHAAALPERERLYVDALAALYQIDDTLRTELQSGDATRVQTAIDATVEKAKSGRDEKVLQRAFLKGLEAVVAACPDDVEAKALLAIQCWRNQDFGIEITSHAAVDALLDAVFAKAPNHPAHHYRVHLWDGEKAERALRSAAAIGGTAPAIAHQWHMAGHVYAKLHRHGEAAWQQEASSRTDHAAHGARSCDAVPDPQLRPQPGMVGAQPVVDRRSARSPGVSPRTWRRTAAASAPQPARRRRRDRRLRAGAPRVGVRRPRAVGRGNRTRGAGLPRAHRLGEGRSAAPVVARPCKLPARPHADGDRCSPKPRHCWRRRGSGGRRRSIAPRPKCTRSASRRPRPAKRWPRRGESRARACVRCSTCCASCAVSSCSRGDAGGRWRSSKVCDFPKTLLADARVAAKQAGKAIELLEAEVKERPRRAPTLARLLYGARCVGSNGSPHAPSGAVRRLRSVFGAVGQCLRAARGGTARCWNAGGRSGSSSVRHCSRCLGTIRRTFCTAPTSALARALDARPGVVRAVAAPRLRPAARRRRTLRARREAEQADAGRLLPRLRLPALRRAAARPPQGRGSSPRWASTSSRSATTRRGELAAATSPRWADAALPFPVLADPEHAAFRAWRCYDDFESLPLHGTFLVDGEAGALAGPRRATVHAVRLAADREPAAARAAAAGGTRRGARAPATSPCGPCRCCEDASELPLPSAPRRGILPDFTPRHDTPEARLVVVPRKQRSKDKVITDKKSLAMILAGLRASGKVVVLTTACSTCCTSATPAASRMRARAATCWSSRSTVRQVGGGAEGQGPADRAEPTSAWRCSRAWASSTT